RLRRRDQPARRAVCSHLVRPAPLTRVTGVTPAEPLPTAADRRRVRSAGPGRDLLLSLTRDRPVPA
ncbi:MAG: hypothetical protein AAF907_00480, partial [Planctomycetota bacterium]